MLTGAVFFPDTVYDDGEPWSYKFTNNDTNISLVSLLLGWRAPRHHPEISRGKEAFMT